MNKTHLRLALSRMHTFVDNFFFVSNGLIKFALKLFALKSHSSEVNNFTIFCSTGR